MAWSDAARQAAALARKRKAQLAAAGKRRVPTVGENRAEMDAMLGRSARLRARVSAATLYAMHQAEMRAPSHQLYGRPIPGMVEAAPGVYQRRDEFARTLRDARAQVRARSSETTAKGRNLHARVVAGRMVQAIFQRRK